MRKHILAVMTAILVLALATAAMAADPFVGTWKLNLEKSKLVAVGIQSSTTKTETVENGLTTIRDEVRNGKTSHSENTIKFDGNYHPNPDGSWSESCTRIYTNSFTCVRKLKGAAEDGLRVYNAVSLDGMMRFSITAGIGKDTQGILQIAVMEKQ